MKNIGAILEAQDATYNNGEYEDVLNAWLNRDQGSTEILSKLCSIHPFIKCLTE